MNPIQAHPNATTGATVGACVTIMLYIASVLGWTPPAEVGAAITTIATAVVVGIGPLVRYQARQDAQVATPPVPPAS